jgi:hypothetical protein
MQVVVVSGGCDVIQRPHHHHGTVILIDGILVGPASGPELCNGLVQLFTTMDPIPCTFVAYITCNTVYVYRIFFLFLSSIAETMFMTWNFPNLPKSVRPNHQRLIFVRFWASSASPYKNLAWLENFVCTVY